MTMLQLSNRSWRTRTWMVFMGFCTCVTWRNTFANLYQLFTWNFQAVWWYVLVCCKSILWQSFPSCRVGRRKRTLPKSRLFFPNLADKQMKQTQTSSRSPCSKKKSTPRKFGTTSNLYVWLLGSNRFCWFLHMCINWNMGWQLAKQLTTHVLQISLFVFFSEVLWNHSVDVFQRFLLPWALGGGVSQKKLRSCFVFFPLIIFFCNRQIYIF